MRQCIGSKTLGFDGSEGGAQNRDQVGTGGSRDVKGMSPRLGDAGGLSGHGGPVLEGRRG